MKHYSRLYLKLHIFVLRLNSRFHRDIWVKSHTRPEFYFMHTITFFLQTITITLTKRTQCLKNAAYIFDSLFHFVFPSFLWTFFHLFHFECLKFSFISFSLFHFCLSLSFFHLFLWSKKNHSQKEVWIWMWVKLPEPKLLWQSKKSFFWQSKKSFFWFFGKVVQLWNRT